ncbi:hypothetical protein T11_17466 [Trichinella zimbabwensis]|uniref:Uncharacterized protein n=1 Tax=Trichinella zimbabwensis TaxID=268475 RepID=A0A0V1G893_9BILA|nr:hypothetical protein T11_17466 [Trichinella zimbabwensis]
MMPGPGQTNFSNQGLRRVVMTMVTLSKNVSKTAAVY